MELLDVLSWACIVFTVGMFSSGLSDLRKMFATHSTDNIQFLPFLTTDLNNLGWLYYGQLKNDWTLMTVNTIGAVLQTIYILAFFYFTAEKSGVLYKLLAALALLFVSSIYFTTVVTDEARLTQLGLFCSIFTISMYISPLVDLAKIISTKSTKCLSFPLTVATFLTSASWSLYGMQLNDFYIMIPNLPGVVTSLIRFWLFWQYSHSQEKYPYRPVQA
ncbi:sugar transporter SWEET1 [Protopterus annectens]|uniref:sugar transporter SWEET1 n=1 Tax=Protopterus annectens TaxID=7888 RepID=UPI001CFB1796|nr:sugar transporter SWEET1 [Protopterus annectens]